MGVMLSGMFFDILISAAKNITVNEKINQSKYAWLLDTDNTFLNHFSEGWKINLFEFFVSNNKLKPPSTKGYSRLNSRPADGFEVLTKEDELPKSDIEATMKEEGKDTEIDQETSNSDKQKKDPATGERKKMGSMHTIKKFVGRDYYTLSINEMPRKAKKKPVSCDPKGRCCHKEHTGLEMV